MAAYQIQFGQEVAGIYGCAQPELAEQIPDAFPELGFPQFIWTRSRIFGFRDMIVSIDCTDHVAASGWSRNSLEPFRALTKQGGFEIFNEKS